MLVEEILEGFTTSFGKSGNKVVKKYRCTSGSRKGRVVAKSSTCSAPINVKKKMNLKKTKARRGSMMRTKARITKKSNSTSIRNRAINQSRKRSGSSSRGKRI